MTLMRLLIINPGSTSTKISVFEEEAEVCRKTVVHNSEELKAFPKIMDQLDYRRELILGELKQAGFTMEDFDAVCSRGGLVRHIPSGTYRINEQVIEDLRRCINGEHASNLGPVLAKELGDRAGIPSYFADPIVVDELQELARYSGFAGMERESIFHALNHKSVARKAAAGLGKRYEELNLILAHLGGGVSVGAHRKGKVIDVFNTREEGAMCMDRGGSVPTSKVIDFCFSGVSREEARRVLCRESGIYSYLKTREFREVEEKAFAGDSEAMTIFRVFAYQLAKDIGAMGAVLEFEVDGIILTGGIAHSDRLCAEITRYVSEMAPVLRMPGEEEMSALAESALRVLHGEEANTY